MLRHAKVGDRVRCVLNGWGTITKKTEGDNLIKVKFDNELTTESVYYYFDGRLSGRHLYSAITEVRPQKWEPKLGNCLLTILGNIEFLDHEELSGSDKNKLKTEAGMFGTLAQAQVARDYTRTLRRQLAWLFEHYSEEDGEWSEETKWSVCYDFENKNCRVEYDSLVWVCPTTVYMSREAAEHLAQELNSGRVEL